jgi:hypothetical protein
MWAEVIFSRDDLARLLSGALPLTIHLGAPEADHSLSLCELGDVQLVADTGLRVQCKARIHWPLLGIDVPVEVSSLTLLLIPTVEEGHDGARVVFRASVEKADFAALPALIDDRITSAINTRLAAKGAELSWNFSKALAYLAPLPSRLEPLESFAIRPAWGKVRITAEGIVYAASFHAAFVRRGDAPPFDGPTAAVAAPRATVPSPTRAGDRGTDLTARLFTAGVLALAAGFAYLGFRRAGRYRVFG